MTDLEMVNQYYKSLQVEKQMLWLDLEKKRGAAYDWLGKNPEPIIAWFDQHMA